MSADDARGGDGAFCGQVCVVTGGGRGIGRAVAAELAAGGAVVHALDLAHGAMIAGVQDRVCDVTDPAQVGAALAAAGARVDVLVNNAASVTRAAAITELGLEEWETALRANLTGVFLVTRAALPLMGRGGRIVNLASTFGHVGAAGRVAYATTKAGILGFTRSLALEVAGAGIRVNSVSPGAVATERLVAHFGSAAEAEARLAPLHPLGRTAAPEEIANAICYLASARASFVTGADLLVDGGYTAR